jgi:hypothetical protein
MTVALPSMIALLEMPQTELSSLQRAKVRRVSQMFRKHVARGDGCWTWTGRIHRDGYGQFKLDLQARHAHIIGWLIENRAPLDGKEVDHICQNRACVRPDHLRLQTHRQNTLRNSGPVARRYREARGLEPGVLEEDLVVVPEEVSGEIGQEWWSPFWVPEKKGVQL